ncbi:NmrA/HSCARG family protein [Arthrobacter koreensis]|uniref:NmrA/HSCARG family protein n=1 Tax=Arthrobacter koreensis TaxID=199136 RepID=UPI002DB8B5FB|nr:NmrA/HSCARG family protein [Arthrobacter koreensis]MEB7504152.1 NmrA/HSCARG family protein [Arthrobacter koreensis]
MPKAPGTIAVVGATGRQGGAAAVELLVPGARVRALVRDPATAKAAALAERGVELVTGDLTRSDTLAPLFEGVDAAYAMTTMYPNGTDYETATGLAIAEAASSAGVPHLVYSSVGGAERNSGVSHFQSKRRVEERIGELGLNATFLRPVLFMDNFSEFGVDVEDGTVTVRLPFPDGIPLEMLAVRDLGRAAGSVLLGAEVPGGAVEIGGDKRTGSQIAEAFGEAAGLPARYEALPLEAVGADSDMAAMFRWFAETPAYQADFEATRALVGGDGPLDLPGWIRHVQWTPDS